MSAGPPGWRACADKDTCRRLRAGYLVARKSGERDKATVVDDTLKLLAAFQETVYRLLVLHLLRDDEATGKGIEAAGCAAMLLGGLGEEQVASVLQVWTLVEVSLKGTREETEVFLLNLCGVILLDKEVLLVYDM